ncbi:hypothetical protein GCM10010505_45180 [Kitasatospora aburaviensis]
MDDAEPGRLPEPAGGAGVDGRLDRRAAPGVEAAARGGAQARDADPGVAAAADPPGATTPCGERDDTPRTKRRAATPHPRREARGGGSRQPNRAQISPR